MAGQRRQRLDSASQLLVTVEERKKGVLKDEGRRLRMQVQLEGRFILPGTARLLKNELRRQRRTRPGG